MPTITNLKGLPAPIVEAIMNDDYSRGEADISVTGLLQPPRLSALAERYKDDLTEDASDRIWSLLGKSVHAMIEKTSSYGLSEERLFTQSNGWTVSGAFDHITLYEDCGQIVLHDWKVTSVWTLVYADRLAEWEAQGNMYAGVLLHEKGIKVDAIENIAILRDWQHSKAKDEGYPETAAVKVPLTLWSPEEARRFMDKRVLLHQQARTKLPKCSDEDRWAKPSKYAVYKHKKDGTLYVRAHRLYDAKADANDEANVVDGVVEYREGEQWTRCKGYCPVSQYCQQYLEGGMGLA